MKCPFGQQSRCHARTNTLSRVRKAFHWAAPLPGTDNQCLAQNGKRGTKVTAGHFHGSFQEERHYTTRSNSETGSPLSAAKIILTLFPEGGAQEQPPPSRAPFCSSISQPCTGTEGP